MSGVSCQKKETLKTESHILRLALRRPVKTIDPAFVSDFYSMSMAARVYEGLYQYHYLDRPYRIEPALAAEMPTVSSDGLTYFISLKKGVHFQNDTCIEEGKGSGVGRELVAEDVKYSWGRLLDEKLASPGKWTLEGKLESITVKDKYSLEIKLKEPNDRFLHIMAMPFLFIVPKECVEIYGADFAFHPVGTGPFRLISHSNKHFRWEKNPQYRESYFPKSSLEDSGKRIPFIDGIDDEVITEDQPIWLSFIKGEHDMIPRVPYEKIASGDIKALESQGMQFLKETAAEFTYFAFNLEDSVVGGYGEKNKNLRKAISLAYDTAPVISLVYQELAKKAHFLIPPIMSEYDESYKNPWGEVNLVRAKELLEKAGYKSGAEVPEIILDTSAEAADRVLAEFFANAVARIGIKVTVNQRSWPELLSRIQRKQGQIYAVSWLYDYPDIENGLQILLSQNISPGPNKSNYKNTRYDLLVKRLLKTHKKAERQKILKEIRAVLAEDLPWIYSVYKYETRLLHPWVKNYKIHLFDFGIERYLRLGSHQ